MIITGDEEAAEIVRRAKGVPRDAGKARDKAAAVIGANRRYASDAKAIKAASPATWEKIKSGELKVTQAKQQVTGKSEFLGACQDVHGAC